MNEWAKTSDRMPTKYTRVIAVIQHRNAPDDGYAKMILTCYLGDLGWLHVEERYIVTFWMYCPATPTK